MSVEMQMQMRRNVEQMHQTAADLEDFIGEIGKRDANLRGVAPTGSGAKGGKNEEEEEEEERREIEEAKAELRRLSAEQDEAQKKQEKAAGEKKKKTGALTHNQKYANWEAFDADGIVTKMEEREADAERLRKEVVRLENARAQAKARKEAAMAAAASDALKLQGNDAFGAARYEEAVGLYTDALGHAPRNGVLYANRALALLKLHAHAEAEEDCDAALLLDPSNVKAMLRRAQARHATEQYDLALEDLEAALEREPKNAGARSLMAECRRLKAAATPKPKPKLVPITIEACKHDPDNDDDPFVNTLAPLTPPPPPQQPVKVTAETAATNEAAVVDISGAEASTAGGAADGSSASADGASTAAAAASKAAAASTASKVARALPSATPTADSFGTPSTLAEMERAWRSLRNTPDEFALLVRRVEPERMKSLFKASLPAELFSAILTSLDTHFFPEHAAQAYEVLRALTSAGRFSILTMCLDKADTKALGSIFAKLEENKEVGLPEDAAAALPALKKQYA